MGSVSSAQRLSREATFHFLEVTARKGDSESSRKCIFLLTNRWKPIIISSFQGYLRSFWSSGCDRDFPADGESLGRFQESKPVKRLVERHYPNEYEGIFFMAKRRGNPNWGKPEPIGPITPTITEFEQVVREYKLSPDQYLRSTRLREWARRNKNSKYIPEPLLEAWGFEIESTL